VVAKPGAKATPEELMEFCKTLIAGYKCPRSVEISDKPLPLSGAGKILCASCASRSGRTASGASADEAAC